ncbi:MAG TPA: D-alanine--D-alanine ligase [Clostridiales bacterium]|nr:D-alanine--D-alanine ligase [Clostridiales bacterium]
MNIVVLAGGLSAEREVSLSSGSMVCAALNRSGHSAVLVDVFFGPGELKDARDFFSAPGNEEQFNIDEHAPDLLKVRAMRGDSGLGTVGKNVIEICRAADIVYMGLHGEDGENGRMQAFFDVLGIKYTGSGYLGSALAMNKAVTRRILAGTGVPMPGGVALLKGQDRQPAYDVGVPCIVKPCSGGSSIGITIAHNREETDRALDEAFSYEDEVLVEEYIAGREFSVGVLGDTVLPPIEIIPKEGFYDYAHKYQPGFTEEICPADIDGQVEARMKTLAKRAFDELRMQVYGRGDFIMTPQGSLYFLEMNTLPGMTPLSLLPQEARAAGISYEELCGRVIALSLQKYE